MAFASALDRSDFAAAGTLLAPDAIYFARLGALRGPEAIVQSYVGADAWAKHHLGSIGYESSVVAMTGSDFEITFVDHIAHAGESHTYRCSQRIHVSASGLVSRIEHRELPGQREALQAFLRQVGVDVAAAARESDD